MRARVIGVDVGGTKVSVAVLEGSTRYGSQAGVRGAALLATQEAARERKVGAR